MKAKHLTLIALCSTLLVGCNANSTSSSSVSGNKVVDAERSWQQDTLRLFNNSVNADGGYTLLVAEQQPSLNETLYAVKLLNRTGRAVPNREKLSAVLLALQSQPINLRDLNSLLDLTQGIELMKMLDVPISHDYQESLTLALQKFQNPDGIFRLAKNETLETSVMITEMCVTLLSDINPNYQNNNLQTSLHSLEQDDTLLNASPEYRWTIMESVSNIENRIGGMPFYHTPSGHNFLEMMSEDARNIFSKAPSQPIEFLNDASLYHLLTKAGKKPVLGKPFVDSLKGLQLKDGGFNLISPTKADLKVTDSLSDMIPELGNFSLYDVTNDVLAHQLPSGLFTYRIPNQSSPINSYRVAIIMKDLQADSPAGLLRYFSMNTPTTPISPRELYFLNKGRSLFKQGQIQGVEEKTTPVEQVSKSDRFYAAFNHFETNSMTEQEKNDTLTFLTGLKHEDGGYGFEIDSNFEDSHLIVEFLFALGKPDTSESLTQWVKSRQQEDGGFAGKDVSDLIDTYHALWILHGNNVKPEKLDEITKFLDARKLVSGGFSYTVEQPVNSISATFYGCESLRILGELEKK